MQRAPIIFPTATASSPGAAPVGQDDFGTQPHDNGKDLRGADEQPPGHRPVGVRQNVECPRRHVGRATSICAGKRH